MGYRSRAIYSSTRMHCSKKGQGRRPHLDLPRLAGPAAGSGLSVRLSSGRLYIHAIHGCGVLGPKRKCRQRRSRHCTEAGQLPAFESESQYGVRIRPRQRAGEILGFVMAAWSEEERIEDSDLYDCTNFGFETGTICVAGAKLKFCRFARPMESASTAPDFP